MSAKCLAVDFVEQRVPPQPVDLPLRGLNEPLPGGDLRKAAIRSVVRSRKGSDKQ